MEESQAQHKTDKNALLQTPIIFRYCLLLYTTTYYIYRERAKCKRHAMPERMAMELKRQAAVT